MKALESPKMISKREWMGHFKQDSPKGGSRSRKETHVSIETNIMTPNHAVQMAIPQQLNDQIQKKQEEIGNTSSDRLQSCHLRMLRV